MSKKDNNKEEQRQLKVINNRLEGLIKSTVNSKINLKQGKEWSYDPKKKTIIYPVEGEKGVKQLPSEVFIGTLLHELGHAKYSKEIDVDTIPEPKKDYILLFNCLEDIRIEKQLVKRFPGTYDNLKELQTFSDQYYDEVTLKTQFPPHINLLLNIIRNEWGLETHFTNKDVEKFFDKNQGLIQKAVDRDSSQDLHEFAKKKLWKKFLKLIPPPEEEDDKQDQQQDNQDQQEQGQDGQQDQQEGDNQQNKEQQDQDSGDNEQDDKQEDSEQDGEQDGEQDKNNETQEQEQNSEEQQQMKEQIQKAISIDDITDALKGKSKKSSSKASSNSLLSQLKEKPPEVEDTPELAKSDFLDKIKEEVEGRCYGRPTTLTYEQLYNSIKDYLRYFSSKLNSILVDNNLKRFGGAYKSGKLNSKLLYKWKCNNTKLFSRQVMRMHKQYSVCLLIDESGSMQGSNILESTKAAVLLSEVLDKIGIPFEISGFNASNRIYKHYDQRFTWAVKRNLEAPLLEVHSRNAGDTNDAFSINWANHRLQQREGEKILIVLSDGEPNPINYDIPLADQRRLPKTLRQYDDFDLRTEIRKVQKNATIVGVGLGYGGNYVKKVYPQHVTCDDVSKLPKLLLGILQKQIKRG